MRAALLIVTRLPILAALLTGCATIPSEESADISPDDYAVITDSYWGSLRYNKAGIWRVDGTDLNFIERVKVEPGRHTVMVYCAHGYGLGSQLYATTRTVEFEAKAGHKYQTKCSKEQGAWIEDTATEEVVGRERSIRIESVAAIKEQAEQGDAESQYRLYEALFPGDPTRYQWLCRAADQGHPGAQYEVGRLLQTGGELRANVISAYVWYRLSAKNGNTNGGDAATKLLRIMTTEQAEKAEQLLSEWEPGQCKRDVIVDITNS